MQTKNTLRYGLLILFLLFPLLAACGDRDKPPSPSQSVTLTFACLESEESAYRNLADQFEAANLDVRVQLVLLEPTSDLTAVARQVDTLIFPASPALTRQGLVRDLSPFIQTDSAFQPQDFYPNTLESLQWDGGAWGVPFAVRLQAIFYDREAFDQAGVSYPQPGWTWDDFLAKAQALTAREGNEVRRWGFVWSVRDPLPFIRGRAGPLVDASAQPPLPLLDRPEVAQAVRWFADLALVHQVMPDLSPASSGLAKTIRLVESGQAAMWNAGTGSWPRQSAGRTLGMAPFPVDTPASATTPLELSSYVMSAGTMYPQESWRWLAFLSRQAVGGGMPARRSVAEGSGYWDGLDAEVTAAYRFALEHSFSRIEASWLGGALEEALTRILAGEQGVEEALVEAQLMASTSIAGALTENTLETPVIVTTPMPEATPNGEQVTITFLAAQGWELGGTYESLAARFHESHPEITVKVKEPEYTEYYQTVDVAFLAPQADCFELMRPPRDKEREFILSLDPLLAADPSFSLEDFHPQFLEPFRREGQLWGLPAQGYPRVMYYDKALFDAAGLAYPAPGWTLDDFFTLAAALTQGEGRDKQYGYAPWPIPLSDPLFFIEQQGARLVDDATHPVAYLFDTPEVSQAVRWYANLNRSGIIPAVEGYSDVLLESEWFNQYSANFARWGFLFLEGRAAMWFYYPGLGNESDLWRDLDVGMVPVPQGPGQVGDFTLGGYYISAQTQHPQACWEWLKFLTEQVGIVQGVPARRSVAESQAYRQQVGSELADVYSSTLAQSQRLATWNQTLDFSEQRTAYVAVQLQKALEAAIAGADVEQALVEAQRKVDTYVRCMETTTGFADESELIDLCMAQAEAIGP
jgi:multiple sugar transport system substrate-binding protein